MASGIQDNSTDDSIYENWNSVVEMVYSGPVDTTESAYDQLAENFYDLYRTTGNRAYLNFALHEASSNRRNEILARLSENELQQNSSIVSKLSVREINSNYYSIRDFSADDIYTFLGLRIPENFEAQARKLLEYWAKTLPSDYRDNPIKASFKTQALVHGFFQLDEYEKIYQISQYIHDSNAFPFSHFSLDLYNKLAFSARMGGYYQQTLTIYQNFILPIAKNLAEEGRYLQVQMDFASTLFRIGNINSALQEYESVYSELEYLTDPRYRSALFNNLAISYLNTGRFDQYVEFQLNAYDIAQIDDNYSQQLSILRNLFIFYRRQSEPDLAFSYLNQALQIAQEKELTTDVASILLSLGIYKRNVEENPDIALGHFYDALEFADESSNYHYYFNSLIEIAETYLLLDEFKDAENYFLQAVELSRSRNDDRGYMQANVRLAKAHTQYNQFEQAGSLISQFTESDFLQLTFDIRAMANNVKVAVLLNNKSYRDAVPVSENMIVEIINWLRESSDQQTGHMRMDPEFSEAFRLHLHLMSKTGDYRNALSAVGDLRNISRSGFYNNPLLKSKILSEEELIQDYNLSNRIQQLRSRYADASEDQRVYLGNELLNAISERNALLNRAFPNYAEASYEVLFPSLRRQLKPDQMIFYFSVFDDQVFRFSITRRGIDLKAYPNQPEYLDILNKAVSTLDHGETDLTLMHDVYQTFFDGAIPGRINHIFFIPDGQFYRLPLEILPVTAPSTPTSYGSTTYLLENYSVSYANTLSDLMKESDDTEIEYAYDMAGFGINNFTDAGHPSLPDLPFSASEIVDGADRLDQFPAKKFFINQESTETNFRQTAGNARILHVATHSKVNNENPLFSSLYLYKNRNPDGEIHTEDDGIIYAYELFDMNLNADLVFLSSCESGTGGYLQGAGVLGFSRAFSYAGAKSLSINLWPIRDQTAADISLRFYDEINRGKNKAEALRESQLYYLNNVNSDPYLWGAFVMYGDIESPFKSSGSENIVSYLLAGTFAAGLLMILMLFYQKRQYWFGLS